jgi:GNAT superfamily N-acetyltransferase
MGDRKLVVIAFVYQSLKLLSRNLRDAVANLVLMTEEIVIRSAEVSDSEGIARVHTHSWQTAYRRLLPDEFLDGLSWQDRQGRWDAILADPSTNTVYVAVNSQQEILGFASLGPSRDEDLIDEVPYELYAIYLAPQVWRKGIGGKLLNAVTAGISGTNPVISLWVLKDNLQGRTFYEKHDFKFDGSVKMANLLGHELEEVRYRKRLPLDGAINNSRNANFREA